MPYTFSDQDFEEISRNILTIEYYIAGIYMNLVVGVVILSLSFTFDFLKWNQHRLLQVKNNTASKNSDDAV